MSKTGATAALLMGLLIVTGAAPIVAQESTRPPTNLKLVGDHWTPWDPPEAGPDAYIIQKGDTLWDLSERWLGDPFLWPQVWDENRYILDSHWIYPGDPLVIPGRPTVVPEEGPPPAEETPPQEQPVDPGYGRQVQEEQPPPAQELPPRLAPLVPIANEGDLYCSGYIDPEPTTSELVIAGRETERVNVAEGDVVYLNHGTDLGIKPGDEFAILRQTDSVNHPATNQALGTFVQRMGRVRVLFAQERRATAVIELSCQDITDGDELVAWAEISAPLRRDMPEFERFNSEPSGGATGQIVLLSPYLNDVGQGNIVYTDLGAASGVQPGDAVTIFRDNGDLPRINLGQAVILTVEPTTSTAKITLSVKESGLGDRVEVTQ
jgi:hypothetical protein